jgi:uncharacterized membrane protein YraQ (UPF0718 family)
MIRKEGSIAAILLSVFLLAYFVPWGAVRIRKGGLEAFLMLQDYARQHVILCLIPALFIAGAIGVFVSQASVMRYFGARANKFLSYSVASVSGTILAVCSCTVLPLFAGITSRGAGLGPAIAFLYSGPAINVLAIVLTARVLGWKLGLARAVGAIVLSVAAGLLMHVFFLKEERARQAGADAFALPDDDGARPLWKTVLYFAAMVGILVFANWGKPATLTVVTRAGATVSGTRVLENAAEITLKTEAGEQVRIPREEVASVTFGQGWYASVYEARFWIAGAFLLALIAMLAAWFQREELLDWGGATWGFAKQILPLLFAGVLAAGFLLGRPGQEALIPNAWVATLVGGNSLWANLLASVSGALMYFATLTEVPILQGLLGSGMGKGPALSLLLAGPALSLPSMLVLRSIMGTKKMLVYVIIVVVLSTLAGWAFGPLL